MENTRISLNGYHLDTELKSVPVSFANALRRILLAEIPCVVISNIEILENTTNMTHEMLQHRVSMLPVNVAPEETAIIRDTKIELNFLPSPDTREVTSDDFVIGGPKQNVILRDIELDTPMYFLTLKPNESLRIKAALSVVLTGRSHVCVSTFRNHIDPEVLKVDRDTFILQSGEDEGIRKEAARIFDAFHYQRSFHRDPKTARPDWFDLSVESNGTLLAKDLVARAAVILKNKINNWKNTPILREANDWYRMETEGETYTLGQLLQELIYIGEMVEFVSRDAGHPLTPKLTIRFQTKNKPEAVITRVITDAIALCDNVLAGVQ
jgi:DNA-directed RNA polymerase subunit L